MAIEDWLLELELILPSLALVVALALGSHVVALCVRCISCYHAPTTLRCSAYTLQPGERGDLGELFVVELELPSMCS